MKEAATNTSNTADREIFATRLLDAPRELVWQVWTRPEHITRWWGPDGFSNTIHTMEPKAGGKWDFIMHSPDGTNFKNLIVYEKLVEPELIVYTHESTPKFHVTVTLEEEGDKTRLTMRMVFPTVEQKENTIKVFGAVEGLKQTLGRLAEYLIKLH